MAKLKSVGCVNVCKYASKEQQQSHSNIVTLYIIPTEEMNKPKKKNERTIVLSKADIFWHQIVTKTKFEVQCCRRAQVHHTCPFLSFVFFFSRFCFSSMRMQMLHKNWIVKQIESLTQIMIYILIEILIKPFTHIYFICIFIYGKEKKWNWKEMADTKTTATTPKINRKSKSKW